MHGLHRMYLIEYRAKELKEAEARSNQLAYGRLIVEVRTHALQSVSIHWGSHWAGCPPLAQVVVRHPEVFSMVIFRYQPVQLQAAAEVRILRACSILCLMVSLPNSIEHLNILL